MSVKEGRTLILKCRVKGRPTPKIHWYRNGHMIVGEKDSNMEVITTE
ncbi:unnamed protein product [Protopolystoma xenopodis]|uniref:Ig-like domain-containing protein n=1 Tax=Protopolystoma xenopodis TaxID=117903 RepID=A0A3S5CQX8_9PLAT|nr:unnamed protein product [Protopolystoma xenopodis]